MKKHKRNPKHQAPPEPQVKQEPPPPLSKHELRRKRRADYYQMLDGELPLARHFKGRIVDAVNHDGIDIAPDGRPIRANWYDYLETRRKHHTNNARACLYLMEQTFRSIRPVILI